MAKAIRLLALVGAALLLAVPAAAIARNPNTFNGMSLPMDNAYITMGAENDVAIFRTGNGSIEIDANATCTGNFAAASLTASNLIATTNLTASNLIETDILLANSISAYTMKMAFFSTNWVTTSYLKTTNMDAAEANIDGLTSGAVITNYAIVSGAVTAASLAAANWITAQNVTASNMVKANTATTGTLSVTNSATVSGTTTTGTLAVINGATVGGTLNAGSVSAPSGTITAQTISADPSINSILMRSYSGTSTITVLSGSVVPLVFDTPLITSNIAVNTVSVNAPNGMSCPPGSLFTFSRSGVYHFEASGGWVNLPGNDAQLGIYTSYETDYAWSSNDASVGGVWAKSSGDVYIPAGGVSFIYMFQSSGSTNSVSPYRRRVSYRLVHAVTL